MKTHGLFRFQTRRHYDLDPFDGVSGVYSLHFEHGVYVGSSRDLRSRIRSWYGLTDNQFTYKCFPTPDHRGTEDRLIRELRRRGVTLLNKVNAVGRPYQKRPRKSKPPKVLKGYHIWRYVTVDGVTKPMSVWCRETGISVELALVRIKQLGWTEQRAVTTRKVR